MGEIFLYIFLFLLTQCKLFGVYVFIALLYMLIPIFSLIKIFMLSINNINLQVKISIVINESISKRCCYCQEIGDFFFFSFYFSFNQLLCFEGTISEVKVDLEEESTPSNNTVAGEALLMNNGSRDTSHSDIQKLQQQLQDIKEQVRVPSMFRFVMRRFNETNNLICVEERSPHRAVYNYLSLLKKQNTFSRTVSQCLLVEYRNNSLLGFYSIYSGEI